MILYHRDLTLVWFQLESTQNDSQWPRLVFCENSFVCESKISGQEFSEILDLGSMDPRFLESSFLKSWILDLGSVDPRFLDKSFLKSWILDPWIQDFWTRVF